MGTTQGAESNYTFLPAGQTLLLDPYTEPGHHAIGRSRGGLTSKIHALVDDRCRPMVIALSPGQDGDSPMLIPMLQALRVARVGPGRPRQTPDAVLADKAYSSRGNRAWLRARRITTVIPEPSDQLANRARRGRKGGRPVDFDAELYRTRNTIERGFNLTKGWRGLATRYEKKAINYRGAVVLRAITLWAS